MLGVHQGIQKAGPASGVFGRFLDIRTDTDEMHCPALGDDRTLEHAILRLGDRRAVAVVRSGPETAWRVRSLRRSP